MITCVLQCDDGKSGRHLRTERRRIIKKL